jgi:hypothetical protein
LDTAQRSAAECAASPAAAPPTHPQRHHGVLGTLPVEELKQQAVSVAVDEPAGHVDAGEDEVQDDHRADIVHLHCMGRALSSADGRGRECRLATGDRAGGWGHSSAATAWHAPVTWNKRK